MARNVGLIKLEGGIGDQSHYNSVFGPIVRRKGGPSKHKIKTSPKMARTRELNNEFGEAAKAAALFRQGLELKRRGVWGLHVTSGLNKLMNAVKKNDSTSARGKRIVEKGLATSAGKAVLTNLDLVLNAPLKRVLSNPITVNTGNKTITINQLVPSRDIKYPKGATHVRIKGGYSRLDFGKVKYELNENEDNILSLKSKTSNNLVLHINAPTLKTGFDFYFIQLEFLQQINAVNYDLENKAYNSMNVVQVG